MDASVVVRGTIVRGVGEAVNFTQIDWLQDQCEEKFGFRPHPGTLNLKLSGEDLDRWLSIRSDDGTPVVPPMPDFCSSKGFAVQIGAVRGAVIYPLVDGYPEDVVEIMAPVHLKDTQGWSDGETISVTFLTD